MDTYRSIRSNGDISPKFVRGDKGTRGHGNAGAEVASGSTLEICPRDDRDKILPLISGVRGKRPNRGSSSRNEGRHRKTAECANTLAVQICYRYCPWSHR